MKKLLVFCVIIGIVTIAMAACSAVPPQAQTPSPAATPSPSPSPSPSLTTDEDTGTRGSMKPFYYINIYFDPDEYIIDSQHSDKVTLSLQSKDEGNDYSLTLIYSVIDDEEATNMDIAAELAEHLKTQGAIIVNEPQECTIGGKKWVAFTINLIDSEETFTADYFIYYEENDYYTLLFTTKSLNYSNIKEPEEQFLQKITYTPSSGLLNVSMEDLTTPPGWPAQQAEFQDFTFQIPESWAELKQYTTQQVALYAPKNGDTNTSNIVVETRKTTTSAPSYKDLTAYDVLELISMTAPRATNVTVGDCYQTPLGYVISASYQMSAGANTVTQTQYIFLLDGHALIVYATDFGGDNTPALDEAVKYMLGTMKGK